LARKKVNIEDRGRLALVAQLLSHPMRVDVLLAHAEMGQASATMLHRAGVGGFHPCFYHQQKCVSAGVLEIKVERRGRGSIELVYDLTDLGWKVLRDAELLGRRID
jgi:hypothetical protein